LGFEKIKKYLDPLTEDSIKQMIRETT